MNMKFSALTALIFFSLLTHAQETPPDASWDSDPLDVLEAPAVPEATPQSQFQEIPDPNAKPTVPAPENLDMSAGSELPMGDSSGQAADVPPPVIEDIAPAAPAVQASEDSAPAEAAKPARKKQKTYKGFKASTYGDEVDHQQEAYFHNIYKNYNEQPTSVESWEQAIGPRKSEAYLIQKGDTLWDISSTLFGDSNYWPKVWSLNKEAIFNPHEINTGLMVRFYPGTGNDAPTLNLAKAGDVNPTQGGSTTDVGGTMNSSTAEVSERTANVVIPPPRRTPKPVLKQIPSSLPQYEMGAIAKQKLKIQVELQKNKFPAAKPYLAFFAAESSVDGNGEIVGTELGAETASDGQLIYVKLNKEDGNSYVIQKNHSKVKSQKFFGGSAQIVEIQGEIEILEKVNDNGTYRALVKKAIQPIQVGGLLVPGHLPLMNISKTNVEEGVGGVVIGGQFEDNRFLMGDESVIYIDNGSSQGLTAGQTLPIYKNERQRNPDVKAKYNDPVIGHVKIVRVSKDFATAFVLDVNTEIKISDYIGTISSSGAAVSAAAPSESSEEDFGDFEQTETPSDSEGGDEEFEL